MTSFLKPGEEEGGANFCRQAITVFTEVQPLVLNLAQPYHQGIVIAAVSSRAADTGFLPLQLGHEVSRRELATQSGVEDLRLKAHFQCNLLGLQTEFRVEAVRKHPAKNITRKEINGQNDV